MIITTTERVEPYEIIETLGTVKGSCVMSKNIGYDLLAGLKTIVGGEITDYRDMLDESRMRSEKRMVEEAEKLGADGIVAVRYASSSVMQGAAEILVYGTAVKLKQKVHNG